MDMEMKMETDMSAEGQNGSEENEVKATDKTIIDGIIEFLKRFIFFKEESLYTLVALWIVATHLHMEFEYIGYLFFHSVEPQSGKSKALEVISELVFESTGILTSITEAILFRTAYGRTQLLDEVDSLTNMKSLRSVLNSGFSRKGKAMRSDKIGSGPWEVKEFPVYGPRALSGIGADILEKTTRDRAFMIEMFPQKVEERREQFLTVEPELSTEITALKGVIVVWADRMKSRVSELYRKMNFPYLKNFRDRTMDISNSLAAIMEAAYEGRTGLVQARKDLIKAITITRKEKMDQWARDKQILRALCSLAEKKDPLIGMASELAEQCLAEGEVVSDSDISIVLIKYNFERKSTRLGGKPRYRYIVEMERLSDILARHPSDGEEPI